MSLILKTRFLAVPQGMQDLGSPTRDRTPDSWQWKHGVPTTGPPGNSQLTTLNEVPHDLHVAQSQGHFCLLILLALSVAFDTASHFLFLEIHSLLLLS